MYLEDTFSFPSSLPVGVLAEEKVSSNSQMLSDKLVVETAGLLLRRRNHISLSSTTTLSAFPMNRDKLIFKTHDSPLTCGLALRDSPIQRCIPFLVQCTFSEHKEVANACEGAYRRILAKNLGVYQQTRVKRAPCACDPESVRRTGTVRSSLQTFTERVEEGGEHLNAISAARRM